MFDLWRSGFIRRPLSSFLDHEPRADEIVWLPDCGPHAYVADPFGITRDGVLTVFVEASTIMCAAARFTIASMTPTTGW